MGNKGQVGYFGPTSLRMNSTSESEWVAAGKFSSGKNVRLKVVYPDKVGVAGDKRR